MLVNRHRMAILTWAVAYPLITVLMGILEPLLVNLAMPLRTLVLSELMVPVMVYVAMPRATAWCASWLSGSSRHPDQRCRS